MLRHRRVILALFFLAWLPAFGDAPPAVPPAEANSHLIKRVEPIYPIAAKDARIGGRLRLNILISASGDVKSAKLATGYPRPDLIQAATSAVKQWKYKPFEQNGKQVAVSTQVDIIFPEGGFGGTPDQQIQAQNEFYAQADKCRAAAVGTNYAEAEQQCKQAVALSNNLPKNRVTERAGVITELANSLLQQHQSEQALPLYEQALALDKSSLKPDNAALSSDYWRLAVAYAAAKDINKADQCYAASVTTMETAIQEWPFMKPEYTSRLKQILDQYAKLKLVQKDTDAAHALQAKAAALQP